VESGGKGVPSPIASPEEVAFRNSTACPIAGNKPGNLIPRNCHSPHHRLAAANALLTSEDAVLVENPSANDQQHHTADQCRVACNG